MAMLKPVPSLDDKSCHIWLARVAELQAQLDAFESMLSNSELERAQRFVKLSLRHDFTCAHGWLRQVLAGYQACDPALMQFSFNDHGKPHLSDGGVSFNMSHSRGVVAIAVMRSGMVGIDVQHHDPQVELLAIAERFFAQEEAAWLKSVPDAQRQAVFYRIWSLKEAYIKAVGLGMALPLSSFAFVASTDSSAAELLRQPTEWQRDWSVHVLDAMDEYSLALITEQECCVPVVVRSLP